MTNSVVVASSTSSTRRPDERLGASCGVLRLRQAYASAAPKGTPAPKCEVAATNESLVEGGAFQVGEFDDSAFRLAPHPAVPRGLAARRAGP